MSGSSAAAAGGGRRRVPVAAALMLLLAALGLGLLFSVNRLATVGGVPSVAYAFWQALGGGLVLLTVGALKGELPRLERRHLLAYLALGSIGFGAPFALLAYTAPRLPASVLALVLALSPPLTYLFALLLRMERGRWLSLLGILFGFAGVAILVVPEAALPEPGMTRWLLLALLAPVCFGWTNVLAAKLRPPATSSLVMAAGLLGGAALFLLPVMIATGQLYLFSSGGADLTVLWATLIVALFHWLLFEIVRLEGPVFFAQFNYLAVLAGIGWAVLIFGERPSVYLWAALVALFLGVTLVIWRPSRARAAGARLIGEGKGS